jgi:hypothetical protein
VPANVHPIGHLTSDGAIKVGDVHSTMEPATRHNVDVVREGCRGAPISFNGYSVDATIWRCDPGDLIVRNEAPRNREDAGKNRPDCYSSLNLHVPLTHASAAAGQRRLGNYPGQPARRPLHAVVMPAVRMAGPLDGAHRDGRPNGFSRRGNRMNTSMNHKAPPITIVRL